MRRLMLNSLDGRHLVFTGESGVGKTHIARAGEAVIELIDQPHGGANIGDTDAVILVVYAGIKDQAFTVPVRHGDI